MGLFTADLIKLGFAEAWVHKIMMVVTTVSYYFIRGSEEYGPLISGKKFEARRSTLSVFIYPMCRRIVNNFIKVLSPRLCSWC